MSYSNQKLFTLEEEVSFWGLQVAEHFYLLYLLTVPEGIIQANLPKVNNMDLRQEAIFYYNQWRNLISGSWTLEKVKNLILSSRDYKERLLKYLSSGIWIGWISYSMVKHMLSELEYFWSKITGAGYNVRDELLFWLFHDETETAALEKLIDPSEEIISSLLRDYIARTQKLSQDLSDERNPLRKEGIDFQLEYRNIVAELEERISSKTLLSNIPHLLTAHVLREAQHSLEIFQRLGYRLNV
jgi:hypothetical protein